MPEVAVAAATLHPVSLTSLVAIEIANANASHRRFHATSCDVIGPTRGGRGGRGRGRGTGQLLQQPGGQRPSTS